MLRKICSVLPKSMRLNELLAVLPPTIQPPGEGEVYARMLETVRRDTGADRAVLAIYRIAGKGRWITYTHDRAEPLFGAQLRLVTATKFLEDVRNAPIKFFGTYEERGPTGDSMSRHAIRHAVGVHVLDLTRTLGVDDFAGVLAVDRRGDGPRFGDEVVRLMEEFAKDVSLLLKAVNERSVRPEPTVEKLTADLRSELVKNGGNLTAAATVVGISPQRARQIFQASPLYNWLAGLRDRRSPSPDTVKALILETRDLRLVGDRVGKSYDQLYELIRHKLDGGLRKLVEGCGLTWEQVHGPAFQRGESPPD